MDFTYISIILYIQRLMVGLAGGIGIMLIEMFLYISRSVRAEQTFETGAKSLKNKKTNKNNPYQTNKDMIKAYTFNDSDPSVSGKVDSLLKPDHDTIESKKIK